MSVLVLAKGHCFLGAHDTTLVISKDVFALYSCAISRVLFCEHAFRYFFLKVLFVWFRFSQIFTFFALDLHVNIAERCTVPEKSNISYVFGCDCELETGFI